MSKNQPANAAKSQSQAFIAAAKAAEANTDESRWEARLKDVAKPPANPRKEEGLKRP